MCRRRSDAGLARSNNASTAEFFNPLVSVSHEFALNVRWSGTLKELVILFDAMPYCLNRHFVVFLVNVSIVGTGPVSFVTKLNIGLIGAGVFAGYHASKAASSDYAVLNGVYDLDINAAEKLVEKIDRVKQRRTSTY